jgi:hypothetical protein
LSEPREADFCNVLAKAKDQRFAGTSATPANVKHMATVRGNEGFTMMAETAVRQRAVRPAPGPTF